MRNPFDGPEPEPVLDVLRRTLAQWREKPSDEFHSLAARIQLGRIYGINASELIVSFPLPSEASPRPDPERQVEEFQRIVLALERLLEPPVGKIFIGHGRSAIWRELKDFIAERLHLPCDEFSRQPGAGLMIFERLESVLADAAFAFVVLTAEDERTDGTLQARQNVIHELGLFQGRLA